MDLNKYHSLNLNNIVVSFLCQEHLVTNLYKVPAVQTKITNTHRRQKTAPLRAVFPLPIIPDSDYRKEVGTPFPTSAEHRILCKEPYLKSGNKAVCRHFDNPVMFCG